MVHIKKNLKKIRIVVQLQVVSDSLRPPWAEICQASLSSAISWSLLELMSI